jgi:hypothetical protein
MMPSRHDGKGGLHLRRSVSNLFASGQARGRTCLVVAVRNIGTGATRRRFGELFTAHQILLRRGIDAHSITAGLPEDLVAPLGYVQNGKQGDNSASEEQDEDSVWLVVQEGCPRCGACAMISSRRHATRPPGNLPGRRSQPALSHLTRSPCENCSSSLARSGKTGSASVAVRDTPISSPHKSVRATARSLNRNASNAPGDIASSC